MLTEERYIMIINHLKEHKFSHLEDLVKLINLSESTIRRDLATLEKANLLKRVRGGAQISQKTLTEFSEQEKTVQNVTAKKRIARYASSLIEDGDCIYLDAGTSTFAMIEYISQANIVIVTNGLKHINALVGKNNISAYIIGGKLKATTRAIIGSDALKNLEKFKFNKCFLGINGVHSEYGFTTPDPEEATLKASAILHSHHAFVLADNSKFAEVSFVKVANLSSATIITEAEPEDMTIYPTTIKVIKS